MERAAPAAVSKFPPPATAKFRSTASEPQLIQPPRLDFLSASYGRSSSGSSSDGGGGRSWEERILDLSAELQQICGSPLTPPCQHAGTAGARFHQRLPTVTCIRGVFEQLYSSASNREITNKKQYTVNTKIQSICKTRGKVLS